MNVNHYFDGQVSSIGFSNDEGRITAGVMAAGEYEFGTSEPERMKITSGTLAAKLPGQSEFVDYRAGTEFRVAANVKFQVRAAQSVAYLCFYGE